MSLHPQSLNISSFEQQWEEDADAGRLSALGEAVVSLTNAACPHSLKVQYFERTLDLFRRHALQNDSIWGRCLVNFGLVLRDRDAEKSVAYFQRALSHYRKAFPDSAYQVHSTYFHIADKSFATGNLAKAISYCDSAIVLQRPYVKTWNWARCLHLRAAIYSQLGDKGKADLFFQVSRPYVDSLAMHRKKYFATIEAVAYRQLNEPQRVVQILSPFERQGQGDHFVRSELGQAYFAMGEWEHAAKYFKRNLQSAPSITARMLVINNLAGAYSHLGKSDQALDLYQSLDTSLLNASMQTLYLTNLSHTLVTAGALEVGLALDHRLRDKVLWQEDIPPLERVRFLSNSLDHLHQDWESRGDIARLRSAAGFLHSAQDILMLGRSALETVSGRQNLARVSHRYYDLGIKILGALYAQNPKEEYITTALEYVESTKALTLREEQGKRWQQESEVTRTDQIAVLLDQLEEADPKDRLRYSDSLYAQVMHIPEVKQIDRGPYSNPAAESDLSDLTSLNYFQHGDSTLSIIRQGKCGEMFWHLDHRDWFYLATRYQEQLRDLRVPAHETSRTATALRQMIAPQEMVENCGRTLIVPDGILAYLPFEPMIAQSHGDLLRSDVSYSFSQAFLRQARSLPHMKGPVVSFAPRFTDTLASTEASLVGRNSAFGSLKYNVQEVKDITLIWPSSAEFVDTNATKDLFLRMSDHTAVLHIATHALGSRMEDNEPTILFHNYESINLADIYRTPIRTNLVVMSACETAVGRYAPGEGVMSFARAFAAAGAKSVVASLWAVNDQSTKEIMVDFHRHLRMGKTKDRALREAKQDFLARSDPRYHHPYYWAGFIAIGDMSPLAAGHSVLMPLAIMGLLLFVLVTLLRKTWH